MELNGCYRTKINSKAFAIPILTASLHSFLTFDPYAHFYNCKFLKSCTA